MTTIQTLLDTLFKNTCTITTNEVRAALEANGVDAGGLGFKAIRDAVNARFHALGPLQRKLMWSPHFAFYIEKARREAAENGDDNISDDELLAWAETLENDEEEAEADAAEREKQMALWSLHSEVVKTLEQRLGVTPHKSGSGSVYFELNGKRLRVSDHELPAQYTNLHGAIHAEIMIGCASKNPQATHFLDENSNQDDIATTISEACELLK